MLSRAGSTRRSRRINKSDISEPRHFEHRIHAGYDKAKGTFTGLPKQWLALLGPARTAGDSSRPSVHDPSTYDAEQVNKLKTVVRGNEKKLPLNDLRNGNMVSRAGTNSSFAHQDGQVSASRMNNNPETHFPNGNSYDSELKIRPSSSTMKTYTVNAENGRETHRPPSQNVSYHGLSSSGEYMPRPGRLTQNSHFNHSANHSTGSITVSDFKKPNAIPIVVAQQNKKGPLTTTERRDLASPSSNCRNRRPVDMQQVSPTGGKCLTKGGRLSDDEFRARILEMIDNFDPRPMLGEKTFLADGSTCSVYVCEEKRRREKVAVKVMNIHGQQQRELMLSEIYLMRHFSHPNIIKMFSSHFINDEVHLILEFLDAGDLTGLITKRRLPEPHIAAISKQVLLGLQYLHGNNIVHRDIKSDAILLRTDGVVKISDLGYSIKLTSTYPTTCSLVGTPYWMAFEVASCQPYGVEADIWSFGVLLMEMVEGEPPNFNETPQEVIELIKRGTFPALTATTRVSDVMHDLISKCIVPASRRSTAQDLLNHAFYSNTMMTEQLCNLFAQLKLEIPKL